MEFLDAAADRDRFADHCPVVEFEHRNRLKGIERGEFLSLVLELGEVDLDPRD